MQKLVGILQTLLSGKDTPLVIALDGPSGAGKSTVAAKLKPVLDLAVIPLDDFFSATIPDFKWDEFTREDKLEYVIDWDRVRTDVISPLVQDRPVSWNPFDFQLGLRADGTYGVEDDLKALRPASGILIEGAYSSSPALADLVDFTILVDAPLEERHRRIALREDPEFLEKWHQRWDAVEDYYFRSTRPKDSFDLVIDSDGQVL